MSRTSDLTARLFAVVRADLTRTRYLLAGMWNTAFGYLVGLLLYYGANGQPNVVVVGVIANVLAISMAFATHKLFVFRTKGNWMVEYFRAYLVYGAMALFGILLLWVLVDEVALPFWIAQGLVIVCTVVASYIGHSRFTFRGGRNAG